jgi:hypothetical protein
MMENLQFHVVTFECKKDSKAFLKAMEAFEVEHDTMPFLVTSALELTDEKNAEVMEAIKVFSK